MSYVLFILMTTPSWAITPVPLSAESWQLQRLVNASEKQLQTVRDLLANGQRDTQTLEHVDEILSQLTRGLGRSIEQFQGTKAYAQALLDVQADESFTRGASDVPARAEPTGPNLEKFVKFQQDSVKANLEDLGQQAKLETAIRTAEPGFLNKLQAQTQLRSWQTNTRLSSQLTQVLAALEGLREEMRKGSSTGLSSLINGANKQNQKQTESALHGPR